MPVYPERALQQRVRGEVVLSVRVSETGVPLEVRITKGVRGDIDAAALDAVRQWRFEPARKNGRPVRTDTVVRFAFEGVQFARTPFPVEPAVGTPSSDAAGGEVAQPTPTRTPTRTRTPTPRHKKTSRKR